MLKTEDRLPGHQLPPANDAELLFKEARRRERRRRVAWALTAVLGATAIAGLVAAAVALLRSDSRPAPVSPPPSATGAMVADKMPSQIVAWSGFRVEVLSSRTGRVLRTLATNVADFMAGPNISVSRSGLVYFDNGIPNHGRPIEVIDQVSVRGGRVTRVARGCLPAVSPDGRFLAFISGSGACTPGIHPPNAITVLDLGSGQRHSWSALSPQGYAKSALLGNLSWSQNDRYLSFSSAVGIGPSEVTSYESLDRTNPTTTLRAARRIPVQSNVEWIGFLDGRASALRGIGILQGSQTFLVTLDPASGRVLSKLTTLPSTPSPRFWELASGSTDAVAHDKFVLLVTGVGYGELYRWDVGTTRPIPVADAVLLAAWVPSG